MKKTLAEEQAQAPTHIAIITRATFIFARPVAVGEIVRVGPTTFREIIATRKGQAHTPKPSDTVRDLVFDDKSSSIKYPEPKRANSEPPRPYQRPPRRRNSFVQIFKP